MLWYFNNFQLLLKLLKKKHDNPEKYKFNLEKT